ncbi:hypothetical protein GCM10020221_24540 [Streptomyces thioluteus]|uniref:Uncharacterized protein n=1 Tax=Streptomyces thioluteus TaxID=66431 RepID=A0ABP6JBB6_STRTU
MSSVDAAASAIETRGIEPVPDNERHGRVRELFPTWVAANISVLLLTMGAALIVFNSLNFWQVLIVAVGRGVVVSFGLVGVLSVLRQVGGVAGRDALPRDVQVSAATSSRARSCGSPASAGRPSTRSPAPTRC